MSRDKIKDKIEASFEWSTPSVECPSFIRNRGGDYLVEAFPNYSICIKADLTEEGTVEIPVMLFNKIAHMLKTNYKDFRNTKWVHPLVCLYSTEVDTFKDFTKTATLWPLAGFLTEIRFKGETFYSGRGLLLDKQFRPLIVTTITATLDSTAEYLVEIKDLNCRIKTEIITDTKNAFYRDLLKKFLPKFLEVIIWGNTQFKGQTPSQYSWSTYGEGYCSKKPILITGLEAKQFLDYKQCPLDFENMQEELNEILKSKIDIRTSTQEYLSDLIFKPYGEQED